jgi:AcrR family transcriptional regulator
LIGKNPHAPLLVDRRTQRTRLALHQALISLMVEKGYDALTVQHIIDRANVGRSTFYAHYDDKEDLLRSGLKDLSKQLSGHEGAKAGTPRDRLFGFSGALFEHAYSHRDTYRAIVGRRSGAIVMAEMRGMLTDLVRREVRTTPPGARLADIPKGALVQFVVGALMSILTWWLDENAKLPPAEADAIFRRLVIGAIGKD